MSTFFISDTHFSHMNILEYENCRRTLLSNDDLITYDNLYNDKNKAEIQAFLANTMDKEIIRRWNSVVKKNHIVWFLGDFCLGNREYTTSVISKLNGIKKMVMGNHHHFKPKEYEEMGFKYVSPYPVILKGKYILSHYPIDTTNTPFYNIYGHVHSNDNFQTFTPNSTCVCIERHNFTPIRIMEFEKDSNSER